MKNTHTPDNHSTTQAKFKFTVWRSDLSRILDVRFGLTINDCLDDLQVIRFYRAGDSPSHVASYLKGKRGLSDFRY